MDRTVRIDVARIESLRVALNHADVRPATGLAALPYAVKYVPKPIHFMWGSLLVGTWDTPLRRAWYEPAILDEVQRMIEEHKRKRG